MISANQLDAHQSKALYLALMLLHILSQTLWLPVEINKWWQIVLFLTTQVRSNLNERGRVECLSLITMQLKNTNLAMTIYSIRTIFFRVAINIINDANTSLTPPFNIRRHLNRLKHHNFCIHPNYQLKEPLDYNNSTYTPNDINMIRLSTLINMISPYTLINMETNYQIRSCNLWINNNSIFRKS